jgi:hypothetical protein
MALPIRHASSDVRELAGADAVTLRVVAAKQPRHRHATSVLDGVALGILPDQAPGRLETAG